MLEAFQQKLSAEKTPTLCNALPAFDAMVFVSGQQMTFWACQGMTHMRTAPWMMKLIITSMTHQQEQAISHIGR